MSQLVETGQNGKPTRDIRKNLGVIEQKAPVVVKPKPLSEATLNRFDWGVGHGEDAFTPEHKLIPANEALKQA